jgi:hypothetical protein
MSMYEVDITLVTVTSVLFRMLKASATDFGSEIWHGVVLLSASEETEDTYLELGAHRRVFMKCEEEET